MEFLSLASLNFHLFPFSIKITWLMGGSYGWPVPCARAIVVLYKYTLVFYHEYREKVNGDFDVERG
jgi:hypothetical protein